MVIHKDDIIITSPTQEIFDYSINLIQEKFNLSEFSILSAFLGMHLTKDENNFISISQQHYVEKLINKFQMFQYNLQNTPAKLGGILDLSNTEIEQNSTLLNNYGQKIYCELIGSLL